MVLGMKKILLCIKSAAAAKSLQSCPTLCDPRDGSPPGSPVPGILQARTLVWVAISFPNAWKWKVKVKSLSRVWLLVTPWTAAYQPTRLLHPWDFPGKSTRVGCHCLLRYKVYMYLYMGFTDGKVVKNPPANARDMSLIPGSGRSPGVENGNPLLYSCLENSMDREAWWAAVCGVTKSHKPHISIYNQFRQHICVVKMS